MNAFTCLLPMFASGTNGWQVGNVFDTLTEFVVRYPEAEPTPNAVVEAALDRWGAVQGSMCWYDDYGWWGIASAKAFDDRYADVFGPYRAKFQAIAIGCWNLMNTGKPVQGPYKYLGGPNVWANRDEGAQPGYFSRPTTWAVPRFPDGVWQYDMWVGDRPDPPECTPNPDPIHPGQTISDPKFCLLGPFQNTVMNGLYLELALRLAVSRQGSEFLAAAKAELGFLHNWFLVPGDQNLLQGFPDGSLLVRERVPTYAALNGSYPPVKGYVSQGFWSGDQGLIMGGLVDKLHVDPSDPTNPLDQSRAIGIARGVLLHQVGDCGVAAWSDAFDDHGDPDDYSCGSGVFWRYLLRAFEQDAGLRSAILTLVTNDPTSNAVHVSAQLAGAAKCAIGNPLFSAFNTLSTLLAAIGVLGQAG
jgi:hypothetical protein